MNAICKSFLLLSIYLVTACTIGKSQLNGERWLSKVIGGDEGKIELLEAERLLDEKGAILAEWREADGGVAWRTTSFRTDPRRILVRCKTTDRKFEVILSPADLIELEKRLATESEKISKIAPEKYRNDLSASQVKAFWTKDALRNWMLALKRRS